MPRKYSMQRRSAAVEETRRRIVEATVQLHNERGIGGTSMQDIADRAGVALATVYRHFPTLDDLVPECGGRNMELNPLPDEEIFSGMKSGAARVRALVRSLFAHYERGCRPYEVGFAESGTLPVLARLMGDLAAEIEGLVAAATRPFEPDERHLRLAVGLCDFRVWRSLTQAGLSTGDAAELIALLLASALSASARSATT